MKEQFRFGIIGSGGIGAIHVEALTQFPDAQLVAVADISAERARQLAASYGSIPYTDVVIKGNFMERIRICTVVTGKTFHEFMDNLEGIQKVADFIELRVDHLKHIALDDIERIKHKITCPAIFTCRKKAEGGLYEGSELERMAILEKACTMAFDYLDIDVASAEKFDFSKKGQTKIIVSFHDFTKTPSLQELEALKIRMKCYPIDIMKFAVLINQNEDRMTITKFLLNKQIDEEMIVIGMGDQGKLIRIIAPLLGSYLTFASTSFSQSAPGQIDIRELQQLYTLIENIVSKEQRKGKPCERSHALCFAKHYCQH